MWPGLGKVWCIGLLITTSTELASLKSTGTKNFKLTQKLKEKNASYFAYREEQRVTMQLFLQPWSKGL